MKKLINFACILLCLSMLCSCSAKVDTQATTTETTTTQEILSTTELQTELTTEESTTETTTEEITETTTVPVQTEEPFEEKIIVNFGDSIFGNYQDLSGENQSISSMIADMTGATVYNCGFGGCKMAYASGTGHQWFSMVKIADSIASGDFSTQENAIPNWSAFEYYGKTYKIKNIEYPSGKGGYSFGRFIASTHDDESNSFSSDPTGMQIYQDINNPKVGYRIYKGLMLSSDNFYFTDGCGDIRFISKLQERQDNVKLTQFPTGIVTINDCIIGHEIPFYEKFSSLDKFILDNAKKYEEYYSKEEQEKYGVVAIEFDVVK